MDCEEAGAQKGHQASRDEEMEGIDEEAGIGERHVLHIPRTRPHHVRRERHAEDDGEHRLQVVHELAGRPTLNDDEDDQEDESRDDIRQHGHDELFLPDAVIGTKAEEQPTFGIQASHLGDVAESEDDGEE